MKTILVVDGDQYVRLLYELELREAGYCVLTAVCGLDALEICSRHKLDLIIIDPLLRDMSGKVLIDWLAKIKSQIPVIVHTEFAEYRSELQKKPVVKFINKTSDLRQLTRAVEQVVTASV